jgi:hypothetical protein
MKPSRKEIYEAIQQANRKLDILLRHSCVDFTREDREVKRQSHEIEKAKHHIPPTDLKASVQPETQVRKDQ